jgi:D-alanyl-D-alanine dipeptidase
VGNPKYENRNLIPLKPFCNPNSIQLGQFCKKSQVQKYCFWPFIGLFLIFLTFEGFGQSSENQLFVIKTTKQYRKWLKQNPGMNLEPLGLRISPLISEVPYQTPNNFTGQVLYKNHSFWVTTAAGLRLKKIQDTLKTMGLSLFFFDTYRPYSVTKKMWEIVPNERYAANPVNGSGHNRGIAVDVTLTDLSTGNPLEMPTGYDNFSDSAHHGFSGLSEQAAKNRDLLKQVMEQYGFRALSTEWWHYSLPNGTNYPVIDLNFRKLKRIKQINSQAPKH